MKKIFYTGLFTVLFCLAVQAATVDGIAGFATQNGGTTGGAGGEVITVTNLADFMTAVRDADPTPRTVYINVPELNSGDDKGKQVKLGNNKTIIGCGSGTFMNGVLLGINGKTNIIIRNLRFSMTSITNTTDPAVYSPTGDEGRPQILVNGGDCISIQGASSNIWIDHCEFSQVDPAVQTNQDLYDGLIDAKNASAYITISWCYFHDHHKTHLVGSSDSDNYDRKMTFHHNYYKNISERLPSYRFGTGHVFNNYYLDAHSSGVNSRMGACLRVESNYFEASTDPVISKNSASVGYWDLHNSTNGADNSNIYSGCSGSQPTTSNCAFTPPYTYASFLDPAANVKAIVLANAGVGKINPGCGTVNTPTRTPSLPAATNTRTRTSTPSATRTSTSVPTSTSSVLPSSTATPTRTRTVTPTRTSSSVPTSTFTPVNTATATRTSSSVPTLTFTPVNTATATRTSSSVPTLTFTPVNTATPTRTSSSVPTLTFTPVNTATATRTSSSVPTLTFTPVNTATATRTSSSVPTLTFTPVNTATATRTSSIVPSSTVSPVNTATATMTVTSTESRVSSSTPTATPTLTYPATRTPSPSLTMTITITNTPVLTFTQTVTLTLTLTITLTGTLTPNPLSPTPTVTMTITVTNTRVLSFTQTVTATNTESQIPSSTPTRTNSPTMTITYHLSPTSTFTPATVSGPWTVDIVLYPNPLQAGKDLKIRVNTSRDCTSFTYKIYTNAFRLARKGAEPVNFQAGENIFTISAHKLRGLAAGTYYCVFEAIDKSNGRLKSPENILVVIRN